MPPHTELLEAEPQTALADPAPSVVTRGLRAAEATLPEASAGAPVAEAAAAVALAPPRPGVAPRPARDADDLHLPRQRAPRRPCPQCDMQTLLRVHRLPEDRNDEAKRGMLRMRCQNRSCGFEGLVPRTRRGGKAYQVAHARAGWAGAFWRLSQRWRDEGPGRLMVGVAVGVVVSLVLGTLFWVKHLEAAADERARAQTDATAAGAKR